MDESEIRPIPSFPGYGVSRDGQVWSRRLRGPGSYLRDEWRPVKAFLSDKGYLKVRVLGCDHRMKTQRVHRLVWIAFNGEIHPHLQVNHRDGIKVNNHLDNLELVTLQENMDHSWKAGLRDGLTGDNAKHAKLSERAVVDARRRYRAGEASISRLAREHGVCHKTMRDALSCRTWNRMKERG